MFLMVGQPTSQFAFCRVNSPTLACKPYDEQITALSLFYKNYRSVHRHEGRAANKSITAGGVARQVAKSTMGRRSGHSRQRHRKGKVQAIFKDIHIIMIL